MRACVDAVIAAEGAVGVLVNNAGYSQSGAVESVELDSIRRQFETNVFGLIRVATGAARDARAALGRIVNISSMGGRLTFPGAGSTTRPSTRSRRSATRCASRSRGSGST